MQQDATVETDTSNTYCIIGAGPSGLAMAAEFKRRGIPYDQVERHHSVGGLWDIENPGSPVYESAHFISSKTQSGFLDFPMPASYPDYPGRQQILDYIRAYADHHQLGEQIRFETSVERVEPEDGAALVTIAGKTRRYRGVVCASGVNWDPILPSIPGDFSGELRHSQTYRRAAEFEGKRVVVLGLGNSGADIACEAARVAQKAWVSVRRGYYFIPKHLFGMPTDVFAHEGPHLPLWLEGPLFSLLLKLLVGDVQKLGMPKPDHALLESHPLLNDQLVHHLRHGDISIKPQISQFSGDEVVFEDQSRVAADVVLFATGYRRSIPYLASGALEGKWAAAHFLTCMNRRFDSLFTLGFAELNGALYPQLSRMARVIGYIAQAQVSDPQAAAQFRQWANSAKFDLSGGRVLIDTPRHAHYCDAHALTRALERAIRHTGEELPRLVAAAPRPLLAAST